MFVFASFFLDRLSVFQFVGFRTEILRLDGTTYKNESNQAAGKACFGFTRGACTVSCTMLVGRTRAWCEV